MRDGGGYRATLLGSGRVMLQGCREHAVAGGLVRYGGPFAISDDHGCFHLPDSRHGCGPSWGCAGDFIDEAGNTVEVDDEGLAGFDVVERCLRQIRGCDAVHAYIDSLDCFGTFAEIGYAAACGKPIYLVIDPKLKPAERFPTEDDPRRYEKFELWFVASLATQWVFGGPDWISADLVNPISPFWLRGSTYQRERGTVVATKL